MLQTQLIVLMLAVIDPRTATSMRALARQWEIDSHGMRRTSILDTISDHSESLQDAALLLALAYRSGYSNNPFSISASTTQRLREGERWDLRESHGRGACLTGDRADILGYRCEMWFNWSVTRFRVTAQYFLRRYHRTSQVCPGDTGFEVPVRIAYALTGRCIATQETMATARLAQRLTSYVESHRAQLRPHLFLHTVYGQDIPL